MICVLAGGVGAARFLRSLLTVVPASEVVAIVNTGDDTVFHGLHVSPDIDTVVYTVSGAIDAERGWGLGGETWTAMGALARYEPFGAPTWFNLGDRDLATHLWRSGRMRDGATLTEVTADLARAWELGITLLPMTNDSVATRLDTEVGDLAFQEYFVKHQHGVAVKTVRFDGVSDAKPAPGVLEAIASADVIVVAPSNPLVSIGPLLAVPGIRDAVTARRSHVVGISPIIAGAALKGPADRLMHELGHESSVVGVARMYTDFCSTLVIDNADAALAGAVETEGMNCIVTETIMSKPGVAESLARAVLSAVKS
jgi:LPPG:FO 2-phospho-L-lactate transferase